MNTRTMLILYFIVMNLIGLSAMVIDKIRAMERRFRIPESVLLIIAVLGSLLLLFWEAPSGVLPE